MDSPFVNFIFQKLKSKHTSRQEIYKLRKTNTFFSRFEGTRGEKKTQIFRTLVVQASAFLQNYAKLRGQCQETYYNLGRAMHQLGIYEFLYIRTEL